MERRRFLQLAAAVAVVPQSRALSGSAEVLSLTVGERPFESPNTHFAAGRAMEPDEMLEMLLEQSRDGSFRWNILGRTEPLFLEQGRRYRFRMMNATACAHSVQLRRHSFELARIHQAPVSGSFKTICLERYNVVEADVLMSRSGPLWLHYQRRPVIV